MSDQHIIVIGASVGGMDALNTILRTLPKDFPAPIVVALHRGKDSDETVLTIVHRGVQLKLREATDKMHLIRGVVYIAPSDYHLLIEDDHCALSLEAPVHHARPSIDVLFESAAEAYEDETIGVILTGGNRDGASGLASIKSAGGITIVQNPKTADNRVMPDAAIAASKVDHILNLDQIGKKLIELVEAGAK